MYREDGHNYSQIIIWRNRDDQWQQLYTGLQGWGGTGSYASAAVNRPANVRSNKHRKGDGVEAVGLETTSKVRPAKDAYSLTQVVTNLNKLATYAKYVSSNSWHCVQARQH